jgi:hypothetical protein
MTGATLQTQAAAVCSASPGWVGGIAVNAAQVAGERSNHLEAVEGEPCTGQRGEASECLEFGSDVLQQIGRVFHGISKVLERYWNRR